MGVCDGVVVGLGVHELCRGVWLGLCLIVYDIVGNANCQKSGV